MEKVTSNSQNYNRFSYVLNNPLKYVDPSGYTALYPWYEYISGPNTYYTHYNDISDPTYTDGSGRVWQYKAESFETANFIGNSDGSWVYKNFEKYNEIIALFNNYAETQTTRQDNLSQSNNFKFTAGAGSLRIEDEGIGSKNSALNTTNYIAGGLGVIGSGMNQIKGTFRLVKRGKFSPGYYESGWLKGNQYVKSKNIYSVSKMGIKISNYANVVTTGVAYYDIATNNQNLFTLTDATVGTAGTMTWIASHYAGVQIPVVGEFVAIYGTLRLTWDVSFYLGYYYGPSTWFGSDNNKWFK